ncbi:hypothetical protein [Bacteroides acidifaciens]|uniref:hypothetical protein n=1 Tax=Bacteroides acidifaciens TaxID=85831 RepID=UPI003F49A534
MPILVKIRHPYFGTQKSDEVRKWLINRDVVVMLDNECMWQAMGNVWKGAD